VTRTKPIARRLVLVVLAAACIPTSHVLADAAEASKQSTTPRPFLPNRVCDGGGWVLRDCSTGEVVVGRLELAVSFRARRRGLQGRGGMPADAGLLLVPANAIHTRRMCFPIDLVYLDCRGTVIAIRRGVRPWRWFVPRVFGAYAVLETPVCASSDIRLGQRLCVETAERR
jgi:hypothetical protein